MAALRAQRLFLVLQSSSSPSTSTARPRARPRRSGAATCRAALCVPSGIRTAQDNLSLELEWIDAPRVPASPSADVSIERLRAIAEAAADRAEMHDIIGKQRDNWNHLLLHSTNSLTLAASVMAAPTMVALKASAGVLLASAAVTMAVVNKIQPSQLANLHTMYSELTGKDAVHTHKNMGMLSINGRGWRSPS